MGPHFPGKCAKITVLSSSFGLPGILNTIQRIYRIYRKRAQLSRIDPRFPTRGVGITVVYTNSLKLRGVVSDPAASIARAGVAAGVWRSHVRAARPSDAAIPAPGAIP